MINKLVALIVGILLFLSSLLSGQFHLGAIGGMNFADLDPYVDGLKKQADSRNVFCAGFLVDYELNEFFVLRTEPMYIQKGGIILDALRDIDDVEMTIKCSYLEFPLFIKTNYENRLNIYVMAGPVFSYLLDCKTELDIFYPVIDDNVTFQGDLMDITKRFDFGVGIGWGFKIPLNQFDIFGEMRYVRGLMNARETGDVTLKAEYQGQEIVEEVTLNKEDNKYANQCLQLLIGVTFSL